MELSVNINPRNEVIKMTIENQTIEHEQVEEVKPKRKYKKRACALRKKTCEKYDKLLNLINLQGDYMMLQAHFIYLAVVMDYATLAQLQNDILPDMKRMGLVKTQYVGGTQAVMLVLKKTAVRHVKGLESSKNAFSVKESSSDFPKLLNIMKIDYLIETIIPQIEEVNSEVAEFQLNMETLKEHLEDSFSTLLLKQKDEPHYYLNLSRSRLGENKDVYRTLKEIRRYSIFNLARQKKSLKQGITLSKAEETALDYHENHYTNGYNSKEYQAIALIDPAKKTEYNYQGGNNHKPKKNQFCEEKLIEYERLPTDPRLIITHFQKQNLYVEMIWMDGVDLVMFNTKRSLSSTYIKNLLESIYMTFIMVYGANFETHLKIYFFNQEQVDAFNRQWYRLKDKLTIYQHNATNLTVEAINMEIEDDYLVTSSK